MTNDPASFAEHWEGTYLARIPDALLSAITGRPQLEWAMERAGLTVVKRYQGGATPESTCVAMRLSARRSWWRDETINDMRYFQPIPSAPEATYPMESSQSVSISKGTFRVPGHPSLYTDDVPRVGYRAVHTYDMPPLGTDAFKMWVLDLVGLNQSHARNARVDWAGSELAPYATSELAVIATTLPAATYDRVVKEGWESASSATRTLARYLNGVAQLNHACLRSHYSAQLLWFSELLLDGYGLRAPLCLLKRVGVPLVSTPDDEYTTEIPAYKGERRPLKDLGLVNGLCTAGITIELPQHRHESVCRGSAQFPARGRVYHGHLAGGDPLDEADDLRSIHVAEFGRYWTTHLLDGRTAIDLVERRDRIWRSVFSKSKFAFKERTRVERERLTARMQRLPIWVCEEIADAAGCERTSKKQKKRRRE